MLGQLPNAPSIYELGVGCVALVGIAALLLMARAQNATLKECRELREGTLESERSRGQLNCLLIDLLATMNLSLASRLSQESDDESRTTLEQIRMAVEEALHEQRQMAVSARVRNLRRSG
jgi:hypothetical protein